jgi:hypothetical protein
VTYPVPSFSTIAGAQSVGGVDLNRLVDGVNDLNNRLVNTSGRLRIRRAANQSIPNNASTTITWDTEDQDVGGFITVPSTTITIPSGLDGSYDCTFRTGGNPGARTLVEIVPVAATTGVPVSFRATVGVNETQGTVSATGLPLVAGDTLTCNVYQNSGSAQNWTAWLSLIRRGTA